MEQNDILRAVTQSASSQNKFVALSNDDIFAALAVQTVGQAGNPPTSEMLRTLSKDETQRRPEIVNLGRSIFRRWNRALHSFACTSDGADQDLKNKILRALTGAEGGAALIAGVLVTAFGLSVVTATLVAILIFRLFVTTASEEICSWWASHLDDSPKELAH